MISDRTKQALASAKAKGVQLGGLREHGREAKAAAIARAKALEPLFAELAGKSAREIAAPGTTATSPRPRASRGLR